MLTYREAQDTFEPTLMGWTLKSLDRYWLAVTVDDGTTEGHPEWAGELLFATVEMAASYDLVDDVAAFRTLSEVKAFIKSMGTPFSYRYFPLNRGDLTRWETAHLDGKPFRPVNVTSRKVFEVQVQELRRKKWRATQ